MGREEDQVDKFPIGMRVLAVDDDPICLRVLETLLLRCQYHVTTTNQAIKALKMLRENKDKFDLVISDVHMPDMDGFKLLELVGLEMDLPVIMLSANGETKAVMKGITHGACDYLLKPVRIEELRNIWQHVVRRRKFDHKERHSLDHDEDHDKLQAASSEGTLAVGDNGLVDHSGKVSRKRKDQDDEDEDYFEENTHESDDPSSQKKPRVVWSVELHRKFVAAVNQLGIDKAVPKRILDIMNVDKLTRENVASHLQKYRLYLKRLSAVASQQANMAAALGGRDTSYLHMSSFNGFGSFHGLSPSAPLQGFSPFQPSGISSTTNPNLLALPGLGTIQIGRTQSTTNNTINDNLLQGIPTSLELDQLQQKQNRIQEASNCLPGVFSTNSSMLLQQTQLRDHLPDLSRCSETWQSAPSLSVYNANTLSMGGGSYGNDNVTSSNMVGNPLNISSNNISSNNLLVMIQDSLIGRDVQCQANSPSANRLLVPSGIDSDPKFLNFRSSTNLKQKLEDPTQHNLVSNLPNQSLLNTRIYEKKMDASMMSQPSFDTQHAKVNKLNIDGRITFIEENMFGSVKMQGGFASSNCNFDELMNAMIKPEREDIIFVDGEIGSDLFPLSTCM